MIIIFSQYYKFTGTYEEQVLGIYFVANYIFISGGTGRDRSVVLHFSS